MFPSFNSEKFDVADFRKIDKSYVRIHSNSKIQSGQTFSEVNGVLKEISK